MLQTPFGIVNVKVEPKDLVKANFRVVKLKTDGRYLIEAEVRTEYVQEIHFSCSFVPVITIVDTDVETGEWLELKSWMSGELKMCIGTVDDSWLQQSRNVKMSAVEYLENGLSLTIEGIRPNEPFTLPFGVAWKQIVEIEQDNFDVWVEAQPVSIYEDLKNT
ncbi:hypothetical protein [Planococcus ruber]|uniref:hypothetical protein n=1 Tax=Planococcus ruber TaxID=2027871 RepID=UPI001FED7CF4|nr:hypothetical protein [Planococcus ruber]MCJ1909797.1 hypothetical protein [Planococcus ruber]